MYIDQCNLNEAIGLAKFGLGTWKLEVQKKEDVLRLTEKKKRLSICCEKGLPCRVIENNCRHVRNIAKKKSAY
jgi:hypothetical protein